MGGCARAAYALAREPAFADVSEIRRKVRGGAVRVGAGVGGGGGFSNHPHLQASR